MKTCAVVIGHKKSSPGAENKSSGLTEFDFNEQLALDIEKQIQGVQVQRIYRRTYTTLPGDINDLGPDFVISLHCNAFNQKASGTEVLFYHRSEKGKQMAYILNDKLVQALGLKNRGVQPITTEDRGGYLLKNAAAPCVIAEPFFIDNDQDLEQVMAKRQSLVSAYAAGIEAIADII